MLQVKDMQTQFRKKYRETEVDMFINEGQEMGVFWTAKTLPEYCPRNDIFKLKPSLFL